ncbi:hypothetical protein [Microcoleus sp. CAWBG58]|nr:hypothetical protein [Microcoleus sp. CAWBG58]
MPKTNSLVNPPPSHGKSEQLSIDKKVDRNFSKFSLRAIGYL